MNAYEFIKKGYGMENIRHLNLHIQIVDEYPQYLVNMVNNLEILLTETFQDNSTSSRFLSKVAALEVVRIVREPRSKLTIPPKVVLMLERPPR